MINYMIKQKQKNKKIRVNEDEKENGCIFIRILFKKE